MSKTKIVIIQRICPHYRVPFYQKLAFLLEENDAELLVLYGREYPGTVPHTVELKESWAKEIKNTYFHFSDKELVWQAAMPLLKDADLIVVEQANRLVLNYLLLLKRKLGSQKIAFWGHGKNFQAIHTDSLAEKWKKLFSRHADWWFAYTKGTRELVTQMGFPGDRITVVQNSIDTEELRVAARTRGPKGVALTRKHLGIEGENTAIYCGGLYKEKKISFLLEACLKIRERITDFNIILIGDGPQAEEVRKFSNRYHWAHFMGEITGADRIPYFKTSKVCLMPGLVGLVVLDSFVLECPLITTDIPIHSPEIDYLEDGINGMIAPHNTDDYAETVVEVLANASLHRQLITGCKASKKEYTIDKMATYFKDGLLKALARE